jgi:mRNA interferase MazF
MGMNSFPKRGEIYWVNLNPTIGSEINKIRPALIVSNNIANEISKIIIAAPITSNVKYIHSFEVKIDLDGTPSKVLLDQIRSIDKIRLKNKIAVLDPTALLNVDQALKIALALT